MTSRNFFLVASLGLLLAACGRHLPPPAPWPPVSPPFVPEGPATQVNVFAGTGEGAPDYGIHNAGGDTFPGAVAPFGMIQWSPDSTRDAGGYKYFATDLHGFSLTHFSGRGIGCYQDFPMLPVLGEPLVSPALVWPRAAFSHEDERAWPGYYGVRIAPGIDVELAVTARAGLARLTFPVSTDATVLWPAGQGAQTNVDAGTRIAVVGDDGLSGSTVSGNCGGAFTYRLFFAARFSRPFRAHGIWEGPRLDVGGNAASGAGAGAWVTFDAPDARPIFLKVGLSFVSAEAAAANLAAEIPGWDFDAVRAATLAAWNARIGRVEVEGGTDEARRVLATALYHAHLHPSVFSDADGRYLGFDGQMHHRAEPHYANFATWDSYRSLAPLQAILAPEAAAMAQSLVDDAAQDPGGGLPRWEHAAANSGGMIGDGPASVLASTYAFGAKAFDHYGALAAMKHGAEDPGATSSGHPVREAAAEYLALGFVPEDRIGASASRTLEYGIADFSLSRLADALGDPDFAAAGLARAAAWRKIFSPARGIPVPRDSTGAEVSGASPTMTRGFTEGDAAQYLWLVPHDLRGLFDALGGNAAAVAKLDQHFAALNAGPHAEQAFLGNEPQAAVPYAYAFAGAPARTQEVVRRALSTLYHDAPGGLPGNDDGGAMGAWATWATLGFFPAIPGVGGFVLSSPRFPKTTVHLANGATLSIDAPQADDARPFVSAMELDGAPWTSPWISWSRLEGGAHLGFDLGAAPTAWGSDPADAPPSFE